MSLGEFMNDKTQTVTALYDSHVHWLMTGEKKSYLDLSSFPTLVQIPTSDLQTKNYRGDWLFGFGWTDTQLTLEKPYLELDRLCPSVPACFIKKDAHSCILNSVALERLVKLIEVVPAMAPFIERDSSGQPTGVLKESAFYSIYPHIPALSDSEIRTYLLEAQEYFLKQGFSHIRDMTTSTTQWRVLKDMHARGEIKLFADINFNAETLKHAQETLLPFIVSEKLAAFDHLKIKGIKIFFDGSLGSETALLNENYKGANHPGHALWPDDDLYAAMKLCWENNLEFSVHTLGDQAVEKVVETARRLYSQKVRGYLNLEHVQLVSPETIVKMKSIYVRCHMQPSHWLSDKSFLNQKLSPRSFKNLFAWEALRRAKVPISFGSDAPIEEADVQKTLEGLFDSAQAGIEEFKGEVFDFYVHPEPSVLGKKAVTYFENLKPVMVQIN